ncbi:MAG: PEFG-CTERM sorting domain-containing protein [Thaumarchaeota archaeon]|nr:PEFG-CTERM sorting domain-containing protein [Nitrososphaerota archaeon]
MKLSKLPMRVLKGGAFLALCVILMSTNFAYAQNPLEISANTNKQSYEPGDKVVITGTVQQIKNENPVTIIVRNPIGNVYEVGQTALLNNVFSHDFVLSDDAQGGIYTVNIRQGDETTQIQFQVTVGQMQVIPVFDSEIKVRGENTSLVEYGNVEVSTVDNSITIQVNTTKMQNGPILEEYQIPKHVIDTPGGQIAVKENGNSIDCTQTESDVERILDCSMQPGTKELTFAGTVVIPEFGDITVLILTLSIMTVMMIFSRNRRLSSHLR